MQTISIPAKTILCLLIASTLPVLGAPNDPIKDESTEEGKLINTLPDGGLPPVVGVRNLQVFRASRDLPHIDGKGWTYNHHVDLACWKGRLYLAWDNGEKDEDVWPARNLYISSEDGTTWSDPAELFPFGLTTSLRLYFFYAPNGRMLAIGGIRVSHEKLEEALKGGVVVREIRSDHSLGDVFTLIPFKQETPAKPSYRESTDKEFVKACDQLLANRPFLESQDYGVLLGERKMKWHDVARESRRTRNFGKAFNFFHRKDGALVGIAKQGWTVVSTDEGDTWSEPVIPDSLLTNNAKVWGQRTSDGRFALVYNPKPQERFPLAMITSDDGITFNTMRIVHGEVPAMRYEGLHKSAGPQYIRGIAEWASDGSRKEQAMWLVYSVNKEDIWISQVPIPAQKSGWSTYSPKWAPVTLSADGKQLTLEDRDPIDYARAQFVFPESGRLTAEFSVELKHLSSEPLEIDLLSAFGDARPFWLAIRPDGSVTVNGSDKSIASIAVNKPMSFALEASVTGKCAVKIDGKAVTTELPLAQPVSSFQRISFRTGPARGVGKLNPIATGTDKPIEPARFVIRDFAQRS